MRISFVPDTPFVISGVEISGFLLADDEEERRRMLALMMAELRRFRLAYARHRRLSRMRSAYRARRR